MRSPNTLKACFHLCNGPYNYSYVSLKMQIFLHDERAGNELLIQKIDEEVKRKELKCDAYLCKPNF